MVAALLLAAPLVLAACSDDASPSTDTAAAAERPYGDPATTTTNAQSDGDGTLEPAVGAEMLAGLSAEVIGGGQLDLSDYADEPLLLWFWAPF